jgi:DNA-binding winged helix-turn-helix (wHTH) protein
LKKSHASAHDSSELAPGASGTAYNGPGERAAYAFGPFRLFPRERALRRGNRALTLPPKAFDTLLLLVRNAGHLMRKEDLLQALWPETFVEEVNLANKVSLLRKVLGDRGPEWTWIETVAKQGYRFLPAVQQIFNPGARAAEAPPPLSQPRAHRFIALPFELVHAG